VVQALISTIPEFLLFKTKVLIIHHGHAMENRVAALVLNVCDAVTGAVL
jgi:hypothetical protein